MIIQGSGSGLCNKMGLGLKSLSVPWRLDIWLSKQDIGYSGYKKVSDPEPEVQNSTISKKISFDFCISLDYLFFWTSDKGEFFWEKTQKYGKVNFWGCFRSFFSPKLEGTWTTGSNYMNTDPFRIRNPDSHINIPSSPASFHRRIHTHRASKW